MNREIKIDNIIFNVFDNDNIGIDLIGGKLWEPHITKFLKENLDRSEQFIDVGSNYGYHSIVASYFCDSVISIEPQREIINLQIKSILDNKIKNIIHYNFCAGEDSKNVNIPFVDYYDTSKSMNFGDLSIIETEGTWTPMLTLDGLSNYLKKLKIIKIDVQGYEKFVVEGSSKIINDYKPYFIVEMEEHQLRKFGYGCVDLFKYFNNLNYIPYLIDYHYPSDFVFVHEDKISEFINVNNKNIKPLTENNLLNNCALHGVKWKIQYDHDIKYNVVKKIF